MVFNRSAKFTQRADSNKSEERKVTSIKKTLPVPKVNNLY